MDDDSIGRSAHARHLLSAETRPRMARAHLRKAEDCEWTQRVGEAIERVQRRSGLSLKEFAAVIQRNERQVARWFAGTENAQLAAIIAVPTLRQLLIVALAEVVGECVEITTAITIRRRA